MKTGDIITMGTDTLRVLGIRGQVTAQGIRETVICRRVRRSMVEAHTYQGGQIVGRSVFNSDSPTARALIAYASRKTEVNPL